MKSCILCFSFATLSLLLLLSASCAKQAAVTPEEPPSAGSGTVMSELHATRKELLDAIASVSDEKLKTAVGNQPSPSEAVEALIIRERNLLTAMGASVLGTGAPEEDRRIFPESRCRRRATEAAESFVTPWMPASQRSALTAFAYCRTLRGSMGQISPGFPCYARRQHCLRARNELQLEAQDCQRRHLRRYESNDSVDAAIRAHRQGGADGEGSQVDIIHA